VQERYRVFDEAMLRFNQHLGRIYRCLHWRTTVQCLPCEVAEYENLCGPVQRLCPITAVFDYCAGS
jgi:hypothetical protein